MGMTRGATDRRQTRSPGPKQAAEPLQGNPAFPYLPGSACLPFSGVPSSAPCPPPRDPAAGAGSRPGPMPFILLG